MSTAIYLENCGEAKISNGHFVGFDSPIVAKNLGRLDSTANTFIAPTPPAIDVEMREFLNGLYSQHKARGRKHALRKMAKNRRLKDFAKERGLEVGTFLATLAGLFR